MKDTKQKKGKKKKNKNKQSKKQPKFKLDRKDTILLKDGIWINKIEHPKHYAGRDITKDGKYTLAKALDEKLYTKWIEAERHPDRNNIHFTSECGNYSFKIPLFKHHLENYVKQLGEADTERAFKIWEKLQAQANIIQSCKRLAFPSFNTKFNQGVKSLERSENDIRTLKYKKVIIELFGRMYPLKEIHRICVKNLKIIISKETLMEIEKENLSLISDLHARYKDGDVSDLRLSSKRGRLEEIEDLFYSIKSSFESTGSKSDARMMKELIESARKEEGDKISVKVQGELNMSVKHEISNVSNEIFKYLNINQIIISRVAARMGVNPLQMITDMQQTAYARFNGMLNVQGEEKDEEYAEMIYPTAMPYDFGNIEKAQKMLVAKRQEKIEEIEEAKVIIERVGAEKGTKKSLLEKIKKLKEDNAKTVSELNRIEYLKNKEDQKVSVKKETGVDGRTKEGRELKKYLK